MGLHSAIDEPRKAARATSLLVLVGVINLPIIHYSVEWWNTLHQGATIKVTSSGVETSMSEIMLWSMLIMTFACWFYTIAVVLVRVRSIILEREKDTAWVKELFLEGK